MEKEILTIQNIQHDLRRDIRGIIKAAAIFTVFFLVFLWQCIMLCREGDIKELPLRYLLVFLLTFMCLLMVILALYSIYKTCRLVKHPGNIVKDHLVDLKVKYHFNRGFSYESRHLYFGRYGAYTIPHDNYTWSFWNSMNDEDVYCTSAIDDEFYLVLSNTRTHNILLAYNTKFFQLQEPIRSDENAKGNTDS